MPAMPLSKGESPRCKRRWGAIERSRSGETDCTRLNWAIALLDHALGESPATKEC
jgi:hypothetical protein